MIPEYKLYHGAVLAELVDELTIDVKIGELREDGRLSAYIIDSQVGLYIKHSASRLAPWNFTFTTANAHDLLELRRRCRDVFIVLVCWQDGMVCLELTEVIDVLRAGASDQAWIRIDRLKGCSYSVIASGGELPRKMSKGLGPLLDSIEPSRGSSANRAMPPTNSTTLSGK